MTKSTTLFFSAIVPLIAVMCAATGSNAQSMKTDDAYCQALVNKYTTYVGDDGASRRGRLETDVDAGLAISQCHGGNPGPAIPVLEQKLRDNRVELPSRQ